MYQNNPLTQYLEEKRIDLVKLANKDLTKKDILHAVKGFRKRANADYAPTLQRQIYLSKHRPELPDIDTAYTLSDILKAGKTNKVAGAMISAGTPIKV